MSNFLAKQESVLPLDYKLQVVFVDGKPETIPMGTTGRVGYLGGLPLRERIAQELRELLHAEYGDCHWMTLCFDVEGNEVVVIRARTVPKKAQVRLKHTENLKLGGPSSDIIDI